MAKAKKKSSRKYSAKSGNFSSISIMSILVGLGLALLILIGLNIIRYLNQSKNISAEPASTETAFPSPTYPLNTGS